MRSIVRLLEINLKQYLFLTTIMFKVQFENYLKHETKHLYIQHVVIFFKHVSHTMVNTTVNTIHKMYPPRIQGLDWPCFVIMWTYMTKKVVEILIPSVIMFAVLGYYFLVQYNVLRSFSQEPLQYMTRK